MCCFTFPRRDPRQLFFPTVHDGQWHPTADFDHNLYFQGDTNELGWQKSYGPARYFIDMDKAGKVIEPNHVCYKKSIRRKHKNEDIRVEVADASDDS